MKKEDIDSGTPSLYEWQRECLAAWEQHGRHGIVHVVTGAGKTFLALAAIERTRREYPDLMVRIVVPTIPLARQWETELLHHIGPEAWRPGFFGGGARDDPDRHVMIYVINSARDSLAGHIRRDLALQKHVLLICDECHHYQSRENRKIFSFLRTASRNSVPDTCRRAVKIPEAPAPDPVVHEPGLAEALAPNYAVREPGTVEAPVPDPTVCEPGPAASSPAPLCFTLGLSATPFGTPDDSILIRSLGPEIYRYGFDTAVREGIISPFTVCEVSASFFADEMDAYALLTEKIRQVLARLFAAYPKLKGMGEREFLRAMTRIARESDMDPEEPATAFLLLTYQRKEISSLARARTACCLSLLERLSSEDRILIFCERISQAEDTAAQIRRRFGNICGIYHSEMDREARTRVLTEFRENRVRVLVSCRCLDEGIDVPDANIGIVMSSTAVERQRIQRLGRVIRRAPGKAAACLYYIYIRESTDDAAFLPDLEECETFRLRYYPAEDDFANDLYEYVGACLVRSARSRAYSPERMDELRACLTQGLTRADYLLTEKEQTARVRKADTTHLRNYWRIMRRVGTEFREKDKP